jgi:hypothetical protein
MGRKYTRIISEENLNPHDVNRLSNWANNSIFGFNTQLGQVPTLKIKRTPVGWTPVSIGDTISKKDGAITLNGVDL